MDTEPLDNDQHTQPQNDDRVSVELHQSNDHLGRWIEHGEGEDLDAALRFAIEAANLGDLDQAERGKSLLHLGTVQYLKYRQSKSRTVLSDAIASFQSGLKLPPDSSPEKFLYSNTLLEAIKSRLVSLISLDDLDEGIAIAKFIVSNPFEKQRNGDVFNDLLDFYMKKFEVINDRPEPELSAAIAAGEACLCDPEVLPNIQRSCHLNLGALYFGRYRNTRHKSDIDKAIKHGESVFTHAPPDEPNTSRWCQLLSQSLAERYRVGSKTEDLIRSIKFAWQAKSALEAGNGRGIDRGAVLDNLGNRLGDKYQHGGKLSDLSEAIGLVRKSVDCTAEGDPRLLIYRQNLVTLLNTSFDVNANRKDLDESITISYQIIQNSNHMNYDRPAFLVALGSSLARRYLVQNALRDLNEAIRLGREATDMMNASHPSHVSRNVAISNLAQHLKLLYYREKVPGILKEAMSFQQKCLDSSDPQDINRTMYLTGLANSFDNKFLDTGHISDSDQALQLGAEAIRVRGDTDPDKGSDYTNQSARFWSRYRSKKDTDALEKAVEYAKVGVHCYTESHPNRALSCNNLGNMLKERYNLQCHVEDRNGSREAFLEAFHQENALPTIRIEAGKAAGILYDEEQRWHEAWDVFKQSVGMFPRLSPRSVSRGDQQNSLSHSSGISCLACSAAVMNGESPENCLKILETGRSIISGLAIHSEDDIGRLQVEHPDAYDEFQSLRTQISTGSKTKESSTEKYRAQADRFDKLLQQIRTYPRFDSFLLAPSVDDICALSSNGPIVCFNVTELGSHALLITQASIKILQLQQISYERLKKEAASLFGLSKVKTSTYYDTNLRMTELLRWLWNDTVRPVLDSLGLITSTVDNALLPQILPRIHWMPCGLMSQMPLHAAGIYKPRSKEHINKFVVSSYITTLKSTVQNRTTVSKQLLSPWSNPLLVAMPQTPQNSPLLAEPEAKAVKAVLDKYKTSLRTGSVTVLTQPAKAEVMSALLDCTLAHFACHAESSITDPSASALLLGHADAPAAERLTMAELAELDIPAGKARLAFLSACSTVHLASGFQLMGFRNVIATLWPTNNRAAVQVAKTFYSRLLEDSAASDAEGSEGAGMTYALQEAVKELREKGVSGERKPRYPPFDVLCWAAFVHIGL